jgi:predicted transcriptional regulator
MKRTTIFLEEQLERELQALARQRGRPMAGIVREAVEQYVVLARSAAGKAPRGFVALGRSGAGDIAERHEELLWEDRPGPHRAPDRQPLPPARTTATARATRAKGRRRRRA